MSSLEWNLRCRRQANTNKGRFNRLWTTMMRRAAGHYNSTNKCPCLLLFKICHDSFISQPSHDYLTLLLLMLTLSNYLAGNHFSYVTCLSKWKRNRSIRKLAVSDWFSSLIWYILLYNPNMAMNLHPNSVWSLLVLVCTFTFTRWQKLNSHKRQDNTVFVFFCHLHTSYKEKKQVLFWAADLMHWSDTLI